MFFYFSATGNCKYVAKRLSETFSETMVNIEDCIKEGSYEFDAKGGMVGLVTPTYFYSTPQIVSEFLDKLKVKNPGYCFAVVTFFSATGYIAKSLKEQFPFECVLSVRMPDTYTPIFDLSNPDKVSDTLRKAEIELEEVISLLQSNWKGERNARRFPKAFEIVLKPSYESMRKTKHFTVEDSCIGCGLCAKKCPCGAIEMYDGKPVFCKEKCYICLRCLHHCPNFSIKRGNRTKKHGQYTNPKVKV